LLTISWGSPTMVQGRAANQPLRGTTFNPPIGASLPGALVNSAVIGSPASVDAVTASGDNLASLALGHLPWLSEQFYRTTACTDKDPGEHYRELAAKFGTPCYMRMTHRRRRQFSWTRR
jgi:hypothetical protein